MPASQIRPDVAVLSKPAWNAYAETVPIYWILGKNYLISIYYNAIVSCIINYAILYFNRKREIHFGQKLRNDRAAFRAGVSVVE